MEQTRVLFCSDVHLCHEVYGGKNSQDRLDNMITKMHAYYGKNPFEKIFFLGDYSLDHWAWKEKGSWLELGINNTANFVRDYAGRLPAPCAMLPGNHEQYGNEKWQEITGMPRQFSAVVGGYLIICCDNFSENLDPDYHSDGTYTPTDLTFVKQQLELHLGLPAILCAHFFDCGKEPESFYAFLKEEKRITLLICGHDHIVDVTDLGERADHVCMYHDGHYSCAGGGRHLSDVMWGFCDAQLRSDGVDIRYVEPENTVYPRGKLLEHAYREQHHHFFKRRDI